MQAEFDVSHPWFTFKSNESMVKGDVMVKGGRILLFSSKESMKIMKRSIAIGLDGTLCYLLEMTFPRGDFSQNDFLQR